MNSPWTVRCEVEANGAVEAPEVAGIVSMHLFDAGALAVGEEVGERVVHLVAGFASEDSARRAAGVLADQMPDVSCRVIADDSHRSWVESQQATLHPTTIGPWHVRAPWHEPLDAHSEHDIVIDPGAAFGHGGHPSTRLAIELMLASLERPDVTPPKIVDLGTGTGVIAIIAAKLEYPVRATDSDPAAVEATANNIAANAVESSIELTCGDASETQIGAADFVIANVTIDVHRMLAPSYATADHIVVSGLLCSQVAEMRSLLVHHRAAVIRTSGEWAAIAFKRELLEG